MNFIILDVTPNRIEQSAGSSFITKTPGFGSSVSGMPSEDDMTMDHAEVSSEDPATHLDVSLPAEPTTPRKNRVRSESASPSKTNYSAAEDMLIMTLRGSGMHWDKGTENHPPPNEKRQTGVKMDFFS